MRWGYCVHLKQAVGKNSGTISLHATQRVERKTRILNLRRNY